MLLSLCRDSTESNKSKTKLTYSDYFFIPNNFDIQVHSITNSVHSFAITGIVFLHC